MPPSEPSKTEKLRTTILTILGWGLLSYAAGSCCAKREADAHWTRAHVELYIVEHAKLETEKDAVSFACDDTTFVYYPTNGENGVVRKIPNPSWMAKPPPTLTPSEAVILGNFLGVRGVVTEVTSLLAPTFENVANRNRIIWLWTAATAGGFYYGYQQSAEPTPDCRRPALAEVANDPQFWENLYSLKKRRKSDDFLRSLTSVFPDAIHDWTHPPPSTLQERAPAAP